MAKTCYSSSATVVAAVARRKGKCPGGHVLVSRCRLSQYTEVYLDWAVSSRVSFVVDFSALTHDLFSFRKIYICKSVDIETAVRSHVYLPPLPARYSIDGFRYWLVMGTSFDDWIIVMTSCDYSRKSLKEKNRFNCLYFFHCWLLYIAYQYCFLIFIIIWVLQFPKG